VFFLQQFFPETWTLGPRFEFTTTDNELLTDFRARIAEHTKIKSIGLVHGENWSGPKILYIPKLPWNVPPGGGSHFISSFSQNYAEKVRSLGLQDGELILFKDMDAKLVELSPEEEKSKKEEDDRRRAAWNASRFSTYAPPAESKLVIHQKDVEL